MNKFKIDLAQLLIFEFATYLDFDVRFWENQFANVVILPGTFSLFTGVRCAKVRSEKIQYNKKVL